MRSIDNSIEFALGYSRSTNYRVRVQLITAVFRTFPMGVWEQCIVTVIIILLSLIIVLPWHYYINYSIGIIAGAWPCGTVVMLAELYGAESKAQVYGALHTFLQENEDATSGLCMLLT